MPVRFFLVSLLLFSAVLQTYREAERYVGIDYYQFWLVGGRVLSRSPSAPQSTSQSASRVDVYSDAARAEMGQRGMRDALLSRDAKLVEASRSRPVLETYSTPWLYTVFGVFQNADYATSLARFRGVSLAAFCLAVMIFGVSFGLGFEVSALALALLLRWFEPLHSDLRVANVASLQLFALSLLLLLRARREVQLVAVAGVWLGLVVAFKPNLAVALAAFALDLVLSSRKKAVLWLAAGAAAGVALAVALSAYAFGSLGIWASSYRALSSLPESIITLAQGNVALREVLSFGVFRKLAPLLSAAVLLLIALATLFQRYRASGRRFDSAPSAQQLGLALAGGCVTLLLVSPLAWLHYFVLLVPGMLWMLANPTLLLGRVGGMGQGIQTLLAVLVWLLVGINPFDWLNVRYSTQGYGALVLGASLLVFVSLLVSYRRFLASDAGLHVRDAG